MANKDFRIQFLVIVLIISVFVAFVSWVIWYSEQHPRTPDGWSRISENTTIEHFHDTEHQVGIWRLNGNISVLPDSEYTQP